LAIPKFWAGYATAIEPMLQQLLKRDLPSTKRLQWNRKQL